MIKDPEMTKIYKEANGEVEGKAFPITSEKIFKAMRAAMEIQKVESYNEGWEGAKEAYKVYE